jgi:hypothetical protein
MNKTINFLDPESSPVTVDASQTCNVIIEGVEPETEWNISVRDVDGAETVIRFIGAGVKK